MHTDGCDEEECRPEWQMSRVQLMLFEMGVVLVPLPVAVRRNRQQLMLRTKNKTKSFSLSEYLRLTLSNREHLIRGV